MTIMNDVYFVCNCCDMETESRATFQTALEEMKNQDWYSCYDETDEEWKHYCSKECRYE